MTPTHLSARKSTQDKGAFWQPVSAARKWFNGLQLQHKIGWSFGLAISVSFVGIVTGLSIAESALSRAQVAIEQHELESEMLIELKISLLRLHLHQKGSILTLNDLLQWEEVHATFMADREVFKAAWHRYADFHHDEAHHEDPREDVLTIHTPEKHQLVADLTNSYAAFSQDLERLIEQFDEVNLGQLSESDRQTFQDKLTQFNNEALRQDAYRFLAQVKRLNDLSKIQLSEAKSALARAEIFRLYVIVVSSAISLGITALLIMMLSRAISFSVEKAAATATQVVETSNFDLQIPINSTDEVGRLSTVLNRLISQVKHLLQQEQEKSDSLERALREIKSTQSVLIQNEKMSALGQMVAGIAHEINNPVNFICGNIEPLRSYVEDLTAAVQLYQQHNPLLPVEVLQELEDLDLNYLLQDSEKILVSMEEGTRRILEIVLSLRNFSRLDESDLKRVDLHEGLDSTLIILAHRLKETNQRPEIEVIKNYADLPRVECYAGLLNQVFMNVLSNAIDAIEEMNQTLSYEQIQNNPNQICICTEVVGDDAVRVRIKDNGPGIPAHVIDKLFNPFFTTKAVGKGTGLGLSISYKIVTEKHQGTLQCFSLPGQGTEFVMQVPVAQVMTVRSPEQQDYKQAALL